MEDMISSLKEDGNALFRKKMYKEAIIHFSEAISKFKDADWIAYSGDVRTKITQIFTNRATALHMLNEQRLVALDCTYVLKNLDATN